jgi:hypothetical protein
MPLDLTIRITADTAQAKAERSASVDVETVVAEIVEKSRGRPKNGRPSWDVSPRPVRLDADVDDALCRMSRRHDVSIHALLKLAARMLTEVETDVLMKRLP